MNSAGLYIDKVIAARKEDGTSEMTDDCMTTDEPKPAKLDLCVHLVEAVREGLIKELPPSQVYTWAHDRIQQ
jgi:hypothetical protein